VVSWLSCLPFYPRFGCSNPAEDDEFLRDIKSVARFPSEWKWSSWPHVVRFYGMLNIPAEYDRDTSAKFKDVYRQFLLSLLGFSAVTRELWWMNQERLQRRWGRRVIRNWSHCMGRFVRYHSLTETSNFYWRYELNCPHSVRLVHSRLGGVVCLPLHPRDAGSNRAEVMDFYGDKNLQQTLLRMGSKARGTIS
jgi:hypothetical protein